MSIEENIRNIRKSLPENVLLVAVSKTKPIEDMKEAYEAGIRDFGENKVQELIDKYDNFNNDVNWHLIGHLQRNKVKYIVGKVKLIHSLDSVRLLEEIERQYKAHDLTADVLIQINIGREESKTGILVEDLEEMLECCERCENVRVKGLMAVIPKGKQEENRACFKAMRKIYDDLEARNLKNIQMDCLSMGMSGDYDIAIEEGSNIVRIGTGIFGVRNYNNK